MTKHDRTPRPEHFLNQADGGTSKVFSSEMYHALRLSAVEHSCRLRREVTILEALWLDIQAFQDHLAEGGAPLDSTENDLVRALEGLRRSIIAVTSKAAPEGPQ